jgi:hypothetical protein
MSGRKLLSKGTVLRLAVNDYKFGTLDPLSLRIERVVGVHDLDDGRWVEVAGVMLDPAGSPIKPRPYTLVRVAAIRRSQRNAEAATC